MLTIITGPWQSFLAAMVIAMVIAMTMILGSQNVCSRAEGIADHYWPWAIFFVPVRLSPRSLPAGVLADSEALSGGFEALSGSSEALPTSSEPFPADF